jgi:isoleucyl-tRNA synthetase
MFAVGPDGRYRADWPLVGGSHVYKVNAPDGPICTALVEAGALLSASEDYRHSYPHSWRSKKKLIYRCTPQWFVGMDRDLGDGSTLRSRALAAIGETRWIPGQSKNRIRAMVEGRPDWVLSRQRAWGVPLPLFVHRETGELLVDQQVNARILEAFRAQGADAWWQRDPQEFLGNAHSAADYEQVGDILDVWFDSGTTHAFVTEARLGAEQADLYLEGSDQHRGWFQSSLLTSAATRGRAPYRAVYTHGMTLDDKGRKMSKSLGNVVDPQKLIADSGVDVLRLWVASTDTTEDQRFGRLAMQTVTDAYRKLRNTLRYLLGALKGFSEAEQVAPAAMPALERYILSHLAALDAELDAFLEDHAYARYAQAILEFTVKDLSAFLFDIRKDSLYCDAADSLTRRSYRTLLAILFDWLATRLAPILVFTAEEAWEHRGHEGSVHHATFAKANPAWRDEALEARFERLRAVRALVTAAIEPLRRDKVIGSSLEAAVTLKTDAETAAIIDPASFAELAIVASVEVQARDGETEVMVTSSGQDRCARCWRHLPDVAAATGLCTRCSDAVASLPAEAA